MIRMICKACGHAFVGHSGYFGKICQCGNFVPASQELPIVKENKEKMELLKQKLFEQLQKKHGDLYAYFTKQRKS